jgi:beta-N-acetylhexosaminidase
MTKRNPAVRTFLTNSAMPDTELSAIATAMQPCKQIFAAAFVTVAAFRGSVALEGGLPNFLNTLIKSNTPAALVSLGSPYLFRNFPDVSAYAATFSPSSTSEIAAAKAMLGEIPIVGKLPVSIPGLAKVGDGIQVTGRPAAASQATR